MEEKKNNSIVWIVILILIVFGLFGYIIYDKLIATEPKVEEKEPAKNEASTLEDEYVLEMGKVLYEKAHDAMANGVVFEQTSVGWKEDGSCVNSNGEGCYSVLTNFDEYMDSIVTAKVKKAYVDQNENITRVGNEVRYIANLQRPGNILSMKDELELVSKSSNKLEFKVLTRECDDFDSYTTNGVCKDKDIKVTGSHNLTIIKQNGNWLIDEMPILLGAL